MNILQAVHRMNQAATNLFLENSSGDMTVPQVLLLAKIKEMPGVSQTALVEATGIDRSTLADVTRRLTKKGLVTRRRTRQDARAYAVNLTTEGLAALAKAKPAAARAEKALAEKYPSVKHLLNGH